MSDTYDYKNAEYQRNSRKDCFYKKEMALCYFVWAENNYLVELFLQRNWWFGEWCVLCL